MASPARRQWFLFQQESELRLSPHAYRFTPTDSRGAFTLKALDPARYRLFAFESIAPFAWMDPGILNGVEDLGQDLVVNESERVDTPTQANSL